MSRRLRDQTQNSNQAGKGNVEHIGAQSDEIETYLAGKNKRVHAQNEAIPMSELCGFRTLKIVLRRMIWKTSDECVKIVVN